jgi:hypothetical protein
MMVVQMDMLPQITPTSDDRPMYAMVFARTKFLFVHQSPTSEEEEEKMFFLLS